MFTHPPCPTIQLAKRSSKYLIVMSLMTPAALVPIPAKCTADWVRRNSLAICCHPVSAPTLSPTICLKVPYVGVLTN